MSVKAKNVFSHEEKEKFSGKIRITHTYTTNTKRNTKAKITTKTHGKKLFKNLTF